MLTRLGPSVQRQFFDSLMHTGQLVLTVGVFVDPGADRSFEYDSLTPVFVTLINDEILTLVEDKVGRTLSQDPAQRLISKAGKKT